MATDEKCMAYARECVRLAGLTDDRNVQDQLLDLALGWLVSAAPSARDWLPSMAGSAPTVAAPAMLSPKPI
jgi:hypothetical protein